MIGDFLGNFMVVMMMGACGIALPSIANSVYFVLFVAVLTLWSCCVRCGSWFALLRYLLLMYVAVHVIMIHLTQFEFMQYAWDNRGNETLVERSSIRHVGYFRLTTYLKNREMLRNFTDVRKCRELTRSWEKCQERLFIANFTFGVMEVFNSMMHACLLYDG